MKGLRNHPGENNCFLNVVIQSMWHLKSFRMCMKERVSHECLGNGKCVYDALLHLFQAFQYDERKVLNPNQLRKVLDTLYEHENRFKMGTLNDASEAFEVILQRIIDSLQHQKDMNLPDFLTLPEEVFSLGLCHHYSCSGCAEREERRVSLIVLWSYMEVQMQCFHQHPFSSFERYIQQSILMAEERKHEVCGEKMVHEMKVYHPPKVLTVGLSWSSISIDAIELKVFMNVLSETFDICKVFPLVEYDGVEAELVYQLKGMVCFYGLHYVSIMYASQSQSWYVFDDVNVLSIGQSWEQVIERVVKGRLQPTLLFYERCPSVVDAKMEEEKLFFREFQMV